MQLNQFGFNGFIKKCCLLVAVATSIHTYSNTAQPASDEEAFLIRRIAEFWKDGDYTIVKAQIHEFIKKYPSSTLRDYLQGILADLLLQENQYEQALTIYSTIAEPSVREKIILNKLQCYYELNKYENLIKEGEMYLTHSSPEFAERRNELRFIMAESYFRHSLSLKNETEQAKFIGKAQPFYEELMNTEYGDVSSFALAEIYRISKQSAKGTELYLSLAEKHPSKKESLLFNAALLEANLNKQDAIDLFDKVISLNGQKSGDASFNRLLLYFQTQQFENVINQHRFVYPYVPEDQMPAYHFIVGKSFYHLKDYENASIPLEKYLTQEKESSDQLKDALLIQMTCAKNTNNEPLFDKALSRFKIAYPDDAELGKAYFMHAMLLKKEGHHEKVESILQHIFDQHPNFEDRESLLYEYAIVSHQNEKYQTSYSALQQLFKEYPSSERKQSSWRYFLSCCLHLSKNSEVSQDEGSDQLGYSKNLFLSDLQKVLENKSSLSIDEIREYRLLYAKLAYELSYYNDSLEHLNKYIHDYPTHESLAEAHLLTALSLSKLNADPESFCTHLEKAVELNPDLYDTSPIHLQLYNAYILRAQAPKNKDADLLMEKAAHYLYRAAEDPNNNIKLENKLWLADYYYTISKGYLDEHWSYLPADNKDIASCVDRSFELYNQVLNSDKKTIKTIDSQNLYLEAESLKFAELCGFRGMHEKKIMILQALIEQQNTHPNWNWQFKRQSFFELAKAYEKMSDLQAALETYLFINEFPHVATPITTTTALKTAKLQFELMDKKSKHEKNPDVIMILNRLKDLQIRKNVLSEPTHLEAGLEYAKIRAALSQDSMRDSRYLFFLARLKEDFTSKEDPTLAEYLTALKKNDLQENLYTAYIKFIEAEIFRMQAKLLYNENKKEEGNQYKQKALDLLAEIERQKTPTEYLHQELVKAMKLLR
jgi:tetratricopeptide (TPR) repeat protein